MHCVKGAYKLQTNLNCRRPLSTSFRFGVQLLVLDFKVLERGQEWLWWSLTTTLNQIENVL